MSCWRARRDFELLTPRFVVWCSIQLSYGRVFRQAFGPGAPDASDQSSEAAKERFSYPLRPRLARSGTRDLSIHLRDRIGGGGRKIRVP